MQRVTLTLDEQSEEILEELQESEDLDSRSEAARVALGRISELRAELEALEAQYEEDKREYEQRITELTEEYEEEISELDTEVKHARAKRDELREKLTATAQSVEASNELVEKVERNQTIQEKRAQAGFVTRLKYWWGGMEIEEER